MISTDVGWRAPKTRTQVVGADFEGLIAPHHETNLLGFLVLKQTNISGSPFLPLIALGREPEQLGASGEKRRRGSKVRDGIVDGSAYNLNRTSSFSSLVFTSTCSVNLMTGSKWGSCSSSA